MIKVENIEAWGIKHAIRGMRNPLASWKKSDSEYVPYRNIDRYLTIVEIGNNDLNLMQSLYRGGPEHRKFMRQIFVSMDITAPLYWWKEMDQYKVGTVTDSCSTMHKIHAKEFTLDDFSHEHLDGQEVKAQTFHEEFADWDVLYLTIKALNANRIKYLETKDKKYWYSMIQLLPTSYNQKRTVTMNYENAVNMIRQREFHKLDEWREFVKILRGLPYLEEIMGDMK